MFKGKSTLYDSILSLTSLSFRPLLRRSYSAWSQLRCKHQKRRVDVSLLSLTTLLALCSSNLAIFSEAWGYLCKHSSRWRYSLIAVLYIGTCAIYQLEHVIN